MSRLLWAVSALIYNVVGHWERLDDDNYYVGNDIQATHQPRLEFCAMECRHVNGCKLFVWIPQDGGTCLLKGATNTKTPFPGAQAGRLQGMHRTGESVRHIKNSMKTKKKSHGPKTSTSNMTRFYSHSTSPRQQHSYGEYPIPTLVYHTIPRAAWINELPTAIFTANITTGDPLFHPPLLDRHGNPLTPSITSNPLGNALESHTPNLDFTASNAVDTVNLRLYSKDGSLNAVTTPLSGLFIHSSVPANSDQTCESICGSVLSCAASHYMDNHCIMYAPQDTHSGEIHAGWISNSLRFVKEEPATQYASLRNAALPGVAKSRQIVKSVDDCAALAASSGHVVFEFDGATTCSLIRQAPRLARTTYLVWTPTSPIKLTGEFLPSGRLRSIAATDADTCSRACNPTERPCFGSLWSESKCSLYVPENRPGYTLGWIRKRFSSVASSTQFDRVQFFIVAHQDDHEIFMSHDTIEAIREPRTKVVFIYTTAGDARREDGWWEAREAGTLKASASLIELLGAPLYATDRQYARVRVDKFHTPRIQIGSKIVHYFLRLSEEALNHLVTTNSTQPETPLGPDEAERYSDLNDLKEALAVIIHEESHDIPLVHVGTSEYLDSHANNDDDEVDHNLHQATGRITASVLQENVKWRSCVHQTYYYGYQRWHHPANIPEESRLIQRYMWLQLSKSIQDNYPVGYPVWLDHVQVLGRQYIARTLNSSKMCPLSVSFV